MSISCLFVLVWICVCARRYLVRVPSHTAPLIRPSTQCSRVCVVDPGRQGPLRCHHCNSYINSHSKFVSGGREYVCRLCEDVNEVPESYFVPLDAYGKRTDLEIRPELKNGTVEFIASNPVSLYAISLWLTLLHPHFQYFLIKNIHVHVYAKDIQSFPLNFFSCSMCFLFKLIFMNMPFCPLISGISFTHFISFSLLCSFIY